MQYVCLVYVEPAAFAAMSEQESMSLDERSIANNEELRSSGHLIVAQALDSVATATTVRIRDGEVSTTIGPFAETAEHLDGFVYVEARDLNEAIGIAGRLPVARYGCIEVRPVLDVEARIRERATRCPDVTDDSSRDVGATIDALYREESRRVLATLIRLLGDLDLAEEALQDAFTSATERWPRDGVPASPRAWLVSTGRFKAIDRLRRRARFDAALGELAARLDDELAARGSTEGDEIQDDRLRLLFICCHPALPPDARVAMALCEVCGLTTEEIARAFLTSGPTVAQRIVRAKARIRSEHLPYEVPPPEELPVRLDAVLHVIYLVFTEGYSATSGSSVTRQDLSDEAIRLGRLLVELLPDTEALGLLALMLFQDSRRAARISSDGELVLMADQDRSLWDRAGIDEATASLVRATSTGQVGSFTIQAAIAESHVRADHPDATDWATIVGLYDLLMRIAPSSVVRLNRAVAVAMRDGPEAGLALIDGLMASGELADFHLAHAARADLLRRLDRQQEAREAYQQALLLTAQDPERRFLERRLRQLEA